VRDPRPLIPVVPFAFILPDPLFQPQRASDADRDTAVDILCAAVAEGRLTLTELDERVGAALSARTTCELAALTADLSGPWTSAPASASVGVSPPASPGWASRAPERWSLLQSLAHRPLLPGQPRPAARTWRLRPPIPCVTLCDRLSAGMTLSQPYGQALWR
jgi:hypothetical protein